MVKIDKNIPVPQSGREYPWKQLEVGDSFLVPDTTAKKFGGTVWQARKRTGYKFVTRAVEGGVRVWRVE